MVKLASEKDEDADYLGILEEMSIPTSIRQFIRLAGYPLYHPGCSGDIKKILPY